MKKILSITLSFILTVSLSDRAFSQAGNAASETALPSVTSLSAQTLTQAGRLKITGKNFGIATPSSIVKIGGVAAPVSNWSSTSITAYVSDATALGTANVQVITDNGASNIMALNVTARTQAGRVKWRFQANDLYIQGRPGIGPDGTVYALGIQGHLYALTPNGGLKWIYKAAFGSTQSVSVGNDGTIYFAGLNTVYAINPNGTLKWTVSDPAGRLVDVGPTVGPDGNIYAVTDEAGFGGLGAVSISPNGQILWNKPGFLHANGTAYQTKEVVFSAGQLYFCMNNLNTNSGLQALTLTGNQKWTRPGEFQPAVGPDGRIYVISARLVNSYAEISSFDTRGNLIRKFFGNGTKELTSPDVGSDGVFYVGQNYSYLVATNPDGVTKWKDNGRGFLGGPIASPTNNQVAVGGYEIGKPGYVAAAATGTGQVKWVVVLPAENGGFVRPMSRPRFSNDGSVVYVGMDVNDNAADPYTYLYAFNTGNVSADVSKANSEMKSSFIANDALSNKQLSVYPNPATSVIHIKVDGKRNITISDNAGKIYLSKVIDGSGDINVSTLQKGIYFISDDATRGEGEKLIIQK